MIAFIDDHRQAHGVEPICRVLPIALSTYHAHVAKRVDPSRLSARDRREAVRMVLDHEGEHASRWAAVSSIAAKIGCTAQTLHEWVKKAERDSGVRAGVPTDVATKLKALERENRELRQANEILRKASAYFAQAELDRRFRP